MLPPDQRLFEADLQSAEFRNGVLKGWWGVAEADTRPANLAWPNTILWIRAAQRPNAPERYYFTLNCAGYRAESPTGTFWDPIEKYILDVKKRPKGKPGSRFAKVFRTDWKSALAFYHPYDRVAVSEHAQWRQQQPNLIWDSNHTITDYLEEFRALLQSGDYIGV
jgi:hypothetical protein